MLSSAVACCKRPWIANSLTTAPRLTAIHSASRPIKGAHATLLMSPSSELGRVIASMSEHTHTQSMRHLHAVRQVLPRLKCHLHVVPPWHVHSSLQFTSVNTCIAKKLVAENIYKFSVLQNASCEKRYLSKHQTDTQTVVATARNGCWACICGCHESPMHCRAVGMWADRLSHLFPVSRKG